MKLKLLLLLCVSMFYVGCGSSEEIDTLEPEKEETPNKDPETPEEEESDVMEFVEFKQRSFESDGGSIEIKIRTNSNWEIVMSEDWVKSNTSFGGDCSNYPITLTLTAEFNFFDDRKCVVTLRDRMNKEEKVEVEVSQPKYVRPTTRYMVGDPEVTFDESKFDANYKYNAQMQIWRKAGREGGIPHLKDQLAQVTKVFEAGTPAEEIDEYFSNNRYKSIVVLLKNGEYTFDRSVRIYSNGYLIGESRDGVKITTAANTSGHSTISLYNAQNAGVRNISINGAWLNANGQNTPLYPQLGNEELPDRSGDRTIDMSNCVNCFVDSLVLNNNACHPIWLTGRNNTVRTVSMDSAFNKSGGCEGYFFICSDNALITNCYATRLRHISFQGEKSKNNVFYDNFLNQEITFHAGDGGDNLIEGNKVYLTPKMASSYNAIMGPWSGQHTVGGLNFIYKNRCKEDNPGRNGVTPWSDDRLYLGPYVVSVGTDNPTRYTNFRPTEATAYPPFGTLYPVILE